MSKVSMKLLLYDLEQLSTSAFMDLPTVEIVPRKMVEMIIEKCDRDIEEYEDESHIYGAVRNEARNIKNYALSLLEKFEEEPEKEKPKHCHQCKHFNIEDEKFCVYSCNLTNERVQRFGRCAEWKERGKV